MMLSTASTPGTPRMITAARPTREEQYRGQRVRATRWVAAGLWLVVLALVALIVGMALPLFVGVVRVETLGVGGMLLLAAVGLLLRGRVEIGRARQTYAERRLHAVRVDRGGAS